MQSHVNILVTDNLQFPMTHMWVSLSANKQHRSQGQYYVVTNNLTPEDATPSSVGGVEIDMSESNRRLQIEWEAP